MIHDLTKLFAVLIFIGLPMMAIFGWPMLRRVIEHREKRMELEARTTAGTAAEYSARNERLEQRVRVLERIVTDKGLSVSDEIERLRDEPVN